LRTICQGGWHLVSHLPHAPVTDGVQAPALRERLVGDSAV
jgi:hypothetical protein